MMNSKLVWRLVLDGWVQLNMEYLGGYSGLCKVGRERRGLGGGNTAPTSTIYGFHTLNFKTGNITSKLPSENTILQTQNLPLPLHLAHPPASPRPIAVFALHGNIVGRAAIGNTKPIPHVRYSDLFEGIAFYI